MRARGRKRGGEGGKERRREKEGKSEEEREGGREGDRDVMYTAIDPHQGSLVLNTHLSPCLHLVHSCTVPGSRSQCNVYMCMCDSSQTGQIAIS